MKQFTATDQTGKSINFRGMGNRSDIKNNGGYQLLPHNSITNPKQLIYVTLFKVTGNFNPKTNILIIPPYSEIRMKTGIDTSDKTLYRNLKSLTSSGVFTEVDKKQYKVSHTIQDYFKIPSMFMFVRNLNWEQKLMIGSLYLHAVTTQEPIQFNEDNTGNNKLPCGFKAKDLNELFIDLKSKFSQSEDSINLHSVILNSVEIDHLKSRDNEFKWMKQALDERKISDKLRVENKKYKSLLDL